MNLMEWVQATLPELMSDLNQPATTSEIASLENKLGVELPEQLQAMYLEHNGQKDEINTGLFYGLNFLPLDRVYEEWRSWAEIIDSQGENGMKELSMFSTSHVPGFIKAAYANKKWVPFAHDWAGNYLGLDFDPAENGTVGQVINFGRDEDEKFVIAKSFSEFMQWYTAELESGNYSIVVEDDGGRSFNTKKPQSGHFLDAVKVLFRAV